MTDVQRAIRESRLRVDLKTGLIEGRRPDPKARWRVLKLEPVAGPHQRTCYYRVTFTSSKGTVRAVAHRVVWWAAGREIPKGHELDHRDEKKTNNALSNLRVVTPSQNVLAAVESGACDVRGLTKKQVRAARRRVARGESQRSVARSFGVPHVTIQRIVNGETYGAVR